MIRPRTILQCNVMFEHSEKAHRDSDYTMHWDRCCLYTDIYIIIIIIHIDDWYCGCVCGGDYTCKLRDINILPLHSNGMGWTKLYNYYTGNRNYRLANAMVYSSCCIEVSSSWIHACSLSLYACRVTFLQVTKTTISYRKLQLLLNYYCSNHSENFLIGSYQVSMSEPFLVMWAAIFSVYMNIDLVHE